MYQTTITGIQDSSEYPAVFVSGIQMVKSSDLVDHLNNGQFGT